MTAEQEKMVLDNTPLVTLILKRIYAGMDDWEDLFQVGCYALVLAVQKFDPDKGYQFSTYACRYIEGIILTYRNRKSDSYHGLNISRSYAANYNKAKKYAKEHKLDMKQDRDIISKTTGLNLIDLHITSLDKTVCNDDGDMCAIGDFVADYQNHFEDIELNDLISSIITYLKPRLSQKEHQIVCTAIQYYMDTGCKINQRDIAVMVDCSQPTVTRALKKGLRLLREGQII